MARIKGPVWKKSRRLGFSILETGEELQRRQYAPGQHGPTKRVKLTNYGLQLREKQRIRYMYGVTERQFGNLYKKVKDPNLVGSLSGHTEGSKAFARYRDIDEEMKTDLVKLLE